jgi:hypothetical protein
VSFQIKLFISKDSVEKEVSHFRFRDLLELRTCLEGSKEATTILNNLPYLLGDYNTYATSKAIEILDCKRKM